MVPKEKQDIPDFLEKTTEPTSLPPRRPNSAVLEGRYIFISMNQKVSYYLKVSKFQKQIFLFSFPPKNEWNYFLISALDSKMGRIENIH